MSVTQGVTGTTSAPSTTLTAPVTGITASGSGIAGGTVSVTTPASTSVSAAPTMTTSTVAGGIPSSGLQLNLPVGMTPAMIQQLQQQLNSMLVNPPAQPQAGGSQQPPVRISGQPPQPIPAPPFMTTAVTPIAGNVPPAGHGIFSTKNFWSQAFGRRPFGLQAFSLRDLGGELILEPMGIEPFKSNMAGPESFAMVSCFSRCWVSTKGITGTWAYVVRSICEVLAPVIRAEDKLGMPEAKAEFLKIMKAVLPVEKALRQANAIDANTLLTEVFGTPCTTDQIEDPAGDHVFQGANIDEKIRNAIKLLHAMAHNRKINGRVESLKGLVTMCVALAKQGNVSSAYIRKIETGIYTDTHIMISLILDEIIHAWSAIGRFIDDTNVEQVITYWMNMLPAGAIRQSTLQQIKFNSLTSISTVHRALVSYPTFPWATVALMFPLQRAKVEQALNEVQGHPFYGYRTDLGAVKSSNYKEYAYVAKELLVKLNGEGALDRAACFTRFAKKQAALATLISTFETNSTVAPPVQEDQEPDSIIALARDGANFYGE